MLNVVDAYADYIAFYSGNQQGLLEHLRKQQGKGDTHLQRVSDGEERLRRMRAGEHVGPKDPIPLIGELSAKGRQRARLVAVMPVEESLRTLEEFFGDAQSAAQMPDVMKGEQIPSGSPVKPRSEMIAQLTQELRRERK
jgi:hypothetical protein